MLCCCYRPRAAPTTFGVVLNKEATVEELLAAAAPLAGLSPQEELFPVFKEDSFVPLAPDHKVQQGTFIHYYSFH